MYIVSQKEQQSHKYYLMYTCSKDQRSICCDISHRTCPTKTTVCYHKATVYYQ